MVNQEIEKGLREIEQRAGELTTHDKEALLAAADICQKSEFVKAANILLEAKVAMLESELLNEQTALAICEGNRRNFANRLDTLAAENAALATKCEGWEKAHNGLAESWNKLIPKADDLAAENRELKAILNNTIAELNNIADAKPSGWGDMADQFRPWAQNRARAAVIKATEEFNIE